MIRRIQQEIVDRIYDRIIDDEVGLEIPIYVLFLEAKDASHFEKFKTNRTSFWKARTSEQLRKDMSSELLKYHFLIPTELNTVILLSLHKFVAWTWLCGFDGLSQKIDRICRTRSLLNRGNLEEIERQIEVLLTIRNDKEIETMPTSPQSSPPQKTEMKATISPDTYVALAVRSESTDYETIASRMTGLDTICADEIDTLKIRLRHAADGLTTETGELVDALKRHCFYGTPLDKTNLEEELGDVLWYVALACSALEVSLADVMVKNIDKLYHRYPEKFTEQDAMIRDLLGERAILEGKKS